MGPLILQNVESLIPLQKKMIFFRLFFRANIKPKVQPIRGGTDGANLSFMGLPCPNIFAGGHNFHGKLEYVPLESMMKASEVILNIITLFQAEG